jgi:hypothetical protein
MGRFSSCCLAAPTFARDYSGQNLDEAAEFSASAQILFERDADASRLRDDVQEMLAAGKPAQKRSCRRASMPRISCARQKDWHWTTRRPRLRCSTTRSSSSPGPTRCAATVDTEPEAPHVANRQDRTRAPLASHSVLLHRELRRAGRTRAHDDLSGVRELTGSDGDHGGRVDIHPPRKRTAAGTPAGRSAGRQSATCSWELSRESARGAEVRLWTRKRTLGGT